MGGVEDDDGGLVVDVGVDDVDEEVWVVDETVEETDELEDDELEDDELEDDELEDGALEDVEVTVALDEEVVLGGWVLLEPMSWLAKIAEEKGSQLTG